MMTTEDLQVVTPSVFAESPIPQVTARYTFIPTSKLLDDFAKLGWMVEAAKQQKSHKDKIHTKHILHLRNPMFPAFKGIMPELVIVNAHDRTSAFRFLIGLHVFACLNGVITAEQMFENLRVRHIDYKFEDLRALTQQIIDGMPKVIGTVNKMQTIQLKPEQQTELAIKAIAARFKEYVNKDKSLNTAAITKAIDLKTFLAPVRFEDDNDSVWSVFNRVQEKLSKGGFKRIGTIDERAKLVRPITNIKLDIDVNQKLWQLANSYAV
jgi:hypothetical protein